MSSQPRSVQARIPTRDAMLDAVLAIPGNPLGVVVFAQESGRSRFGPLARDVAGRLQKARLATVLLDLLTPAEARADDRVRHPAFDAGRLARRLVDVVDWVRDAPGTDRLPIGCFGAGRGAAAALVAAAARPQGVRAVASIGGWPDLAGDVLAGVRAPVLLIAAGRDAPVIQSDHHAAAEMADTEVALRVVRDAGPLFEEPGTLDEVAALARAWFLAKLADALDPSAAVEVRPTESGASSPADPYLLDPECGIPGGGRGRWDEVGGSGVHPASAGTAPAGAVIRTQAAWGQGDRGAAG